MRSQMKDRAGNPSKKGTNIRRLPPGSVVTLTNLIKKSHEFKNIPLVLTASARTGGYTRSSSLHGPWASFSSLAARLWVSVI